jgi:elongation factor Ts
MSINLLKKLREETGAGMLDCKKALETSGNDYEKALSSLKQNVSKNESNNRVASKGLCGVKILDNQAILFEVNAETDFVSKNPHFTLLMDQLATILVKSKANYPKEALLVKDGHLSVDDLIKQTASLVKENAYLRRLYRIIKEDDQSFGSYVHLGGKVVTLVILVNKNESLANHLAMQVAANSPTYLSLDLIDENTINYEKFMFEKKHGVFHQEQFDKYLKEITLLEQPDIKNENLKLSDVLKEEKNQIIDFFRFELGQGIEDKLNCKLDIPCDGSKITVTPIMSSERSR